MKKKGFTLVELMAVLLIVAVLALVLIPVVNGIVMSAKKQTFKDTVSGLIDMAYNFESEYTLKNEKNISYPMIITCDGDLCKNSDGDTIDFKGLVPLSGKFILESSSVVRAVAVSNGSLCAAGIKGEIVVSTNCADVDLTGPVINNGKEAEISIIATTNKITVAIPNDLMSDEETGVSGYTIVLYLNGEKIDEKDYNNSAIVFTGLKNNTTYKVLITGTNGNKKTTTIERDVKTKDIVNPTIAYENTPQTAVNGYLQKQVAKVTFSNTNVTNPTYYIKTTRTGTASANTVQACGTGDKPGTCTVSTVTALVADTWYRVSGNINVTYNQTATSEATIYAITYDGNNFSGATTKTISKIDAEKPTVTLGTVTPKTNSLTISYTTADAKTGIGSTTCKYSDTANTYNINGSATSSNCTLTGLTNNKTYYYQVCVTDGVGNAGDCKTGNTATSQFTNPTITYANTPSTAVSDYLKQQVAQVTFSNSNVSNPTYYIKTTRAGTTSANTVASCGNGEKPGTCTTTSTTSLSENIWYKVNGNINVTYNQTATSTATIYAITYDGNNFSGATTKTISKIDAEKPTVTLGTVTPKTNSLTINYTLADAKTGIGSYTCKYSATSGSYTTNGNTVTNTSCTITGLTNNKTYYYQVCATDGVGNAGDCKTGSTATSQFTNPTITYSNTPSTAVSDYLKQQVAQVTFSSSNVTSATYYIKTTRAATASANTVQSCGTGDKPGTCTASTVTSLVADTWYRVSGNINVTYNQTATSTAAIYAITYDGNNFSGATSKTISKIDATKPTVTLGTATSTTNSFEVPYTLADANSGVGSYTCKYSATNGSYTTNGNSVTSTKCNATGLTTNTTYYYQVCVVDGVGNVGDCKTGSVKTATITNPTIAYENTPTTAVNDYLKQQVAKVTFSSTGITSPQYFIKTTRTGTASVNTVQACGTGDKPGSCSNSAVTSLVADTWYKVNGNINVTYNATATSTATIYAITYDGTNFSGATTKTISKIDADKPTVTLGTVTPKTNSLDINYTLADSHSGIGSYSCKYSDTANTYTTNGNTVTNSKCTITGLINNKTYYYQVCAIDGVGNAGDCKTGSTATANFTNPTITYANTPSTAVSDYLKQQVAKVTFSNSNVTSATYYIKTTRTGTASANTVQSCGTADKPGTCSNSAVTTLAANTWYKVSGNINVTYNATATSTATIYAITYDGNNFSGATTKTISKIDAEKPTVTLGTITAKTNSLTINYTLADAKTGIGSYTCKYSDTANTYTTNGNTVNGTSCTITGLANNKTYYYQVCATDGVGNAGDCKTGSTATANFTNPTITYANTPSTAVNDYLKQQVAQISFSNSNVTSATYYIKTTRTGTASANTVQSCGTGDKPGTCSNSAVTALVANTWYKVSGNINVTYNATATSTATIYAITYDGNNFSGATSKTISKIDAEKPTVTLGTVTSKTNSLTINYTLADAKTGIGSYTCKYSATSGSYTTNGNTVTNTSCTITGLTNNKTYYYQICATDGVGNAGDCKTGSTATANFTNPTITYANTPSTAVSDYLKQQVAQVTFSNSNVTSATYYIKTTRAGTASANTVQSCGTGDKPGTCTNSAVTALAANTWYKVSGNINVTYNATATSTATIYAITYDGNNFSGATSKTISKIDAEKPTVTLGTVTSKTNSLTINYTLADAKTGIGSYTCKYSDTANTYTTNGSANTTSCTITGLTNNKTYYYQVCATDGVGNAGDCKTGSTATANFTNPTITYANTPTNAVSDYLKQQVAQVTFSNSNVTSATYYIKTTRAGTASANTVQSCGTADKPGTCTNSAVTSLVANTWYRVSGNINVTYNQTATSTATIYAITYDGNNFSGATSKTISKIDAEKPTVTLGTTTAKTNSLTINYTLADAKTGIGSYTCKYSATSGSYTTNGNTVTNTSCTITGLTNNKTYYYQVCVTDGVGNAGDCKTGSTATANFTAPTITYANTPTNAVSDYLKQQVAKVVFSNSNVSSAQYFIKTTRAGTASANTTQACGTADKPGTCTNSAVTALAANTWYKVNGNINVTYNATATSTATIYAITYDGNNFSGATSKTISKIDAEKPTVTLGTVSNTTNSIVINYTLADAKTGIGSYTCKYSGTSGSYTTNGNTVNGTSCTITGLTNNKTYYYQVCATDGVGNVGDCKTGSKATANFTNPTMTYTNTPTTAVNDYLQQQIITVTFSGTGVSSPTYYIKSGRAATTNNNTVASCGTSTNPGTCTNSAVKSIAANTWYKVSGNINVTYNTNATTTSTLTAITYDGTNFSGSTSKTVSKIDVEKPTLSVSVSGKVATLTKSDAKSGLASYCVNTSNSTSGCSWTSNTAASATWTASTAGTYYAFVKDGVGNVSDAKSFVIDKSAFCSIELGDTWTFAYTGDIQTFTVPSGCSGVFKLEVWGAQGSAGKVHAGGKGGYSVGSVTLNSSDTLNIVVGGTNNYNGGGAPTSTTTNDGGRGGGATHIAKAGGNYTTLSSYGNTTTASSYVYLVAGGGGGGGYTGGGGFGGGTSGTAGGGTLGGGGGTQTAGGASHTTGNGTFGQGANGAPYNGGSGGGGWYGGGQGANYNGGCGGGGGSGYIGSVNDGNTIAGNLALPTHDGTTTMTGNAGNGYAKITYTGNGNQSVYPAVPACSNGRTLSNGDCTYYYSSNASECGTTQECHDFCDCPHASHSGDGHCRYDESQGMSVNWFQDCSDVPKSCTKTENQYRYYTCPNGGTLNGVSCIIE